VNVFIAGTDTGVGKTEVSAALLAALVLRGTRAVGMKPVASGCEDTAQGRRSADALQLIAQSAVAAPYATVNPYALRDPIAPHLAAADEGVTIDLARIAQAYAELRASAACVIVEGVGGWAVPFGAQTMQADLMQTDLMQSDLVRALDLPVLLVVGLRLGCINHALLSARAIAADGCRMIGWIGNRIDPDMARAEDNIATLAARLGAPCLGVLPYAPDADARARASLLARAAELISTDAYPLAP
jgi:dethiobiotin synthetase